MVRKVPWADGRPGERHGALLVSRGLIRGEFGVFRATEDRVVRDIIEELYQKEILAKSCHEREQLLLESLLPQKESTVHFEMTIPMVKESELVVAQCLEQIGKNSN